MFLRIKIFSIGLLVLQAQVLLFRELIVLMKGNEWAIGGILTVWLGATGLGSLIGGRRGGISPQPGVAEVLLGAAVVLPLSLHTLRLLPVLLGYGPGEPLPLAPALAATVVPLLPFCLLTGSLFPLLSRRISGEGSGWRSIRTVYAWEALGAAAGGLLSLGLLTRVNGLTLALVIAAGMVALGSGFAIPGQGLRWSRWIGLFLALVLLGCALSAGKTLDRISREHQWRPLDLRLARETPLGSLALVERRGQSNFYLNGVYQFSYPDPRRAEEKTHLPLLLHPQPEKILLIGGALDGSIREVWKHPSVSEVDLVEADRLWVETVSRLLPETADWYHDPSRVSTVFGDGRRFLGTTRKAYDVILLDLPGPETLQLNRYYTLEFFRLAADRLRPGGLLVFTSPGTVDLPGPAQTRALAVLAGTLQAAFPRRLIFAAENLYLAGFQKQDGGPPDPVRLLARWRDRSLQLRYLTPLQVEDSFSPWRLNTYERLVAQFPHLEINRDLHPVSALQQAAVQLSVQDPVLARLVRRLTLVPFSVWLAGLFILAAGTIATVTRFSPRGSPWPVTISVGVTGLTGLALEVVILLLYQIFVGYLYLQIGALLACFMAGLATGAAWISRIREPGTLPRRPLVVWQCALGALPLALGALLGMDAFRAFLSAGTGNPFLFGLMLLSGFLGGAQYMAGSRLFWGIRPSVNRTAGSLYGADLLGSALGGILVSTLWLPAWGVNRTLLFLTLLNFLTAAGLALWRPGYSGTITGQNQ